MENQALDVESLENLTYERSKIWGKKLEDFLACDEGEELHIDDFDKLFEGEEEIDDPDDIIEEAEEHDVLEDITNHNSASQRKANSGNISKRNGALMLYVGENERDQEEFQDLLDQTLPILVEHKRKWEEAGIERVLKTFDVKKIEEHVGDWLRRNNSTYSEKSICSITPPPRLVRSSTNERPLRYSKKKDNNRDESDVESMHSVDTARYIRSSRKQHRTQRSISSLCTTMTIKTYRMVQSKRDELREKYECPEYDDEHRHRLQQVRCRRLQEKQQRDCEDSYHTCKKKLRPSTDRCYNSSLRRKQLRKRRSSSFAIHSSSDDLSDGCSTSKSSRYDNESQHTMRLGSSRKNEFVHNLHQLSRRERTMQRQCAVDVDNRPYKRESECRCCNDTKLCRNVRHLASSSTEEWLVENDDTMNDSNINQFHQQADSKPKKALKLKQNETKTDRQVSFQSGTKPRQKSVTSFGLKDENRITILDNDTSTEMRSEPSKSKSKSVKSGSKLKSYEVDSNKRVKEDEDSFENDSSDNSTKSKSKILKPKKKNLTILDHGTSREKLSESKNSNTKTVKSGSKSKSSKVDSNKRIKEDEDSFENDASDYSTKSKSKILRSKKKNVTILDSDTSRELKKTNTKTVKSGSKSKSSKVDSNKRIKEDEDSFENDASDYSTKSKSEILRSKKKNVTILDSDTSREKRSESKKVKTKTVDSGSKSKSDKVTTNQIVREDEDNFENDLKLALQLSKKTYQMEKKNKKLKTLQESDTKQSNDEKLQTKKTSLDKMETTTSNNNKQQAIDNTFLANNSHICNSTAHLDDIAKNREFTQDRKAIKRAAAVSTTQLQSNNGSTISSDTLTTSITTAAHNTSKTLKKDKIPKKQETNDDNDCTIVSSTTGTGIELSSQQTPQRTNEMQQTFQSFTAKHTHKGILLYAPHNRRQLPENSFQNGYFTITEAHLSSVLGDTVARKFLKTYIGRRRFNTSSSVYYRPPSSSNIDDTAASKTNEQLDEDSDSDDDIFDVAGRYGVLYESLEKRN